MSLRAAVATAIQFTGEEIPYSCIQVDNGRIRAMTSERGCDLPCGEVPAIAAAVSGDPLRKMLSALGDGAVKLSMAKGRKLQIEGAGVRYHIQAIPPNNEWEFPKPPRKWVRVNADTIEVLTYIERLADDQGAMAGVYCDHTRAVAGNFRQVAIAYAPVVNRPIRVPVGFFKGLAGACKFSTDGRVLWVETDNGALRWTRLLAADFPIAAIDQMVTVVRALPGRFEANVEFEQVAKLATQAQAINEGRVDFCRLAFNGAQLTLEGGSPSSKWGATDFKGSISIGSQGVAAIGTTGLDLQRVSTVLAQLPRPHRMALAPVDGAVLDMWAGQAVIVECLIVPAGRNDDGT